MEAEVVVHSVGLEEEDEVACLLTAATSPGGREHELAAESGPVDPPPATPRGLGPGSTAGR